MSLVYDSRKVIPAPLITLVKNYGAAPAGQKLGTTYDITLTGTLLPFRGSPSGHYATLSAAFWQNSGYPPDEVFTQNNEDFHSILRKQEALRWLFSRDGKSLEWQPAAGQPVVKCNPRVQDITFNEGTWADRCNYQVKLQADWIYINGTLSVEDSFASGLILSAEERWEFNEAEGRNGQQYEVTHTISANGILGYDETGASFAGRDAWQNAKLWVDTRTSGVVDPTIMLGAIGQSNWIGGSYSKTPSIGKMDGAYGVTEKWLIAPSNTFTEKSFNVEYDTTRDEYRVRYEGTIFGLASGKRSGAPEALSAAQAAIPNASDARTAALAQITPLIGGKTLATSPDVQAFGLSLRDGTATFSFEWSTADDANVNIVYTAALNFNADANLYTLTLNADMQGRGATPAEKLTNVKAAILSDADARARALSIIGSQLPGGVTISTAKKGKATSINEKQGSASVSWNWDSNADDNLEINVNFQYPGAINALIPIPGRAAGPIIQDMNTVTEKRVSVSIRSQNNASKPDKDSMRSLSDANAGIAAAGLSVEKDSENWNPTRKTYQRDIQYLVKEGY